MWTPTPLGLAAGWGLFDEGLGDVGVGATTAAVGKGVVVGLLYSRALYVTECIGNWRHARDHGRRAPGR